MMKNWMRRTAALVAGLGLAALAACSGGGDGGDTAAPGTLSGSVVASADATPVADATVSVGERSTRTDASGRYTLTEVPASERAVLRVRATGFVDALVTTPVVAGQTAPASARLLREATPQTFDAASAAVLTTAGSPARVDLPAASLVNAATGAAASGTVTASVTPLDPARDPQTMPGDYSVSDTQRIESFGAIKVNLRDAAGNELDLKPGSTATVRIPLATRSANPPASIPLYWFNEATGRWVEEGSATLAGTAPDQYYEGTVTHFTFWNADMPQDTIYVNGCVADDTGKRVPLAQASTAGIDYSGTASDITDDEGRFRVAIRKGGRANLWAELGEATSNTVVVGPSQVDITLDTCLVLSAAPVAPVVVEAPLALTVETGGNAWFHVAASGTRPMVYQWQRNGVNISGATYEWLAIGAASAGDAGTYTVVIRNAAGSVTSAGAVLTVQAPVAPTIALDPQPLSVAEGETATFSVQATGSAPLAWQWLRNGVAITGATAASYTTPATTVADSGARFSVRVSNTAGSVTSASATLTVTAPVPAAPTITTQPLDRSVQAGNATTFSVAATGLPTPGYQWRRNGTAIAGATAASYTTPALTGADNGATYSVVVSNSQGSVTSREAVLTVTANDTDAKLQLVRLMSLSFDFYEAASMPLLLTDDTGTAFVSPAAVCASGSITGSLNGGALPAPGAAVPPAATLAATASACDVDGTAHTGTASVTYNLTSVEPPVGSATGTVTAVRLRDATGDTVTRDVTANGSGTLTLAGSASGSTVTQSVTLAPGAGATLRNELSALTATFAGGNVSLATDTRSLTGTLSRSRVTYNDLRFAVAGVNYLATGFYELTFTAQGGFAGGSGEAVLSSGGVTVGRIYANASGVFIEVNGISQPFGALRPRAR